MQRFLATMPAAYARAFGSSEVREHAAIVTRRGAQLAHAEICVGSAGPRVCVVAGDRPSLLALITEAFLVHGLGIKSAQVYSRCRPDGQLEAVNFFELQAPSSSPEALGIDSAELSAVVQTLSELVAEDVLAASRPSAPPATGAPASRVYFELEALRRGEYVLLVETPDSDGLLNAITSALLDQSVRILASEIRTEAGIARDRFDLADAGAGPLCAIRLCDIQQAVQAALPKAAQRR